MNGRADLLVSGEREYYAILFRNEGRRGWFIWCDGVWAHLVPKQGLVLSLVRYQGGRCHEYTDLWPVF